MFFSYVAGVLLAVTVSAAQNDNNSTGTGEPCATVSSLLAAGATAVPAQVAEQCLQSAPLVEEDALAIIDGFVGMLEWQSDIPWLMNPPSDYAFPATDLAGILTTLRQRITSGNLVSEIEFERGITTILAKAQDGHLNYVMDGMNVFVFASGFGGINVVSLDGKQAPGIYLNEDLIKYANGSVSAPSAITAYNGVNITQFIFNEIFGNVYVGFQDIDAAFNSYMTGPVDINKPNGGPSSGAFSEAAGIYRGANTTLSFANGTVQARQNYAIAFTDFTGVDDGPSFSLNFCNATQKYLSAGSDNDTSYDTVTDSLAARVVGRQRKRQAAAIPATSSVSKATSVTATATATSSESAAATATQLVGYPVPEIISADGAISGYFLTTSSYQDTAVIVMTQFPANATDFQSTLFQFLQASRAANTTYLVIDVSGNPGGTVGLAYDSFKQFFPDLTPYGAGNFRAHPALNIIGQATTDVATKEEQANPGNITAFQDAGGDSDFDARTSLDVTGILYKSWEDLYGPVTAHGGNFTNLVRLNIANASFDEEFANIDISGYAGQPVGPQPFKSENIIIVGDGECSSTCTVFSHFMKWQGKVKSVAVGGRPMPGPMQSIGGIKGSEVAEVGTAFLSSLLGDLNDDQLSALNQTASAPFFNNVGLMLLRTQSAGSTSGQLSFNLVNNIAEGDSSYTPLQFVYEAADCRLYNTPEYIFDITTKWKTVALQAFGLNGTSVFSGCVAGSTNQPTSLSGNATLFNNGIPTNVTVSAAMAGNRTRF